MTISHAKDARVWEILYAVDIIADWGEGSCAIPTWLGTKHI